MLFNELETRSATSLAIGILISLVSAGEINVARRFSSPSTNSFNFNGEILPKNFSLTADPGGRSCLLSLMNGD